MTRPGAGRIRISAVDPDVFGPLGCQDCGMPASWLLLEPMAVGILARPACDAHATVRRRARVIGQDGGRIATLLLVTVTAIIAAAAFVYLAWQVARAMSPGP